MARLTKLNALAKDGRQIPVDVAVSPVATEDANTLFIVAVRDATEHQAMVRDLEQLATTDPLTGLLNRRSFQAACLREFERFRRQGTPLSLMLIDIDHFKTINDRYGHDVGDQALTQLAVTCLAKLRRTDVMARLGGEEFVVLTPGSKTDDATLLAERLRVSVAQMRTGRDQISFTVSIGLAEAHPADPALDDALARADQALYQAKAEGRNRVIVGKRDDTPASA
jgi:diguanylate cyclase (GGDEF)-like protein